jgi:hypothetical protein
VLTPIATLLKLVGPNNAGLTFDGGDIAKVAKPLIVSGGASPRDVSIGRH